MVGEVFHADMATIAIDFLAKCLDSLACDPNKLRYTFTAIGDDGRPIELCKPGLNPNNRPNLADDAVIFRGDPENENPYDITLVPTSDEVTGVYKDPNPTGIFNIACLGTAISKLHLLRHTSASQIQNAPPQQNGLPQTVPTVAARKTLLRMLTADYCGTGYMLRRTGCP